MRQPFGLICAVLAAPQVFAQALTPPPQEYVIHFQPNLIAYTDQINLGATFTMEAWVFLDAASPFSIVMGKPNNPRGTDPFHSYTLGFEAGGRKPSFIQTTGQPGTYFPITGVTELPLYTWTHLAAVLDAGIMRLYVNGQQVAVRASPGPPAGTLVPFSLGGGIPDGKSICCGFFGGIREARVWGRALSPSELQTYSVRKLTGTEPGLLADWPLAEGSGQVARGVGPQAATLTLKGSPLWTKTTLLENGPYWEIQELPPVTTGTYGVIGAVYLNTDHRPDILLAYTPYALDKPTAGPVLFLHNEGKRVFTPVIPAEPSMVFHPRNRTVADFDGDGLEDVIVADTGWDYEPYPGAVTRIFMQRAGGMKDETNSRFPPLVAFTHDVCSGDINRDGSPDVFFGSSNLYLNDGSGHFRNVNELLPVFTDGRSPNVLSCQFIDINRDGAAELLLGRNNGLNVRNILLLNDGKGKFTDVSAQALPPMRGGPTWATHGFTVVDMNRDGWPDLLVTLAESGFTPPDGIYHTTMQLLINNRDGTFHDQEDAGLNFIRTDGFIDKAYSVDLNQDGWPDLMASKGGPHGVLIYQNMGGHFEDRSETLPPGSWEGLPADFDGDGRIDIALFAETHTRIAWAKNLWPPVAMKTPVVTSVNMAGGFPGIAQNGWIEIKGANLTSENVGPNGMVWSEAREFAAGGMPAYLAGISVTVNGKPAFVYYVSPTQVNVLSPIDSTVGTAQIVVTSGGLSSTPFMVDMRSAAPSFSLFGSKYIVATHADNTLAGPTSLSVPGYPVTPAKPGETIVLWGFGFGLPTTALVNGASKQSGGLPMFPVIQIGGTAATVAFAGLSGPGLYQFNVIVPSTAQGGDNAVTATYNGSAAPAGTFITVTR